jgi:hypothetical protein
MKTIPLRDKTAAIVAFAFVDNEDFDRLNRYRWSLMHGAAARKAEVGGRSRSVLMHREVVGAEHGDGLIVEHANGNPLDNRRENLRVRLGNPGTASTPVDVNRARATG